MSDSISLSSPIVSVEWLHKNLNAKNLIVLNGTIPKVTGDDWTNVQKQITGARYFDIKNKFSDTSAEFPSTIPTPKQFQTEARALGINNDSAIVVYDEKGIYSSARVWWLFKVFGYNNVAVLNGGLPSWEKAGYKTELPSSFKGKPGNFTGIYNPEFMKFFNDVKSAAKHNTHTIIDARSASRYNCKEPEPRAGLRMGAIPNSLNLPFEDLLENGVLKPKVDLEKAFYMLADKNDDIIFSCGSGITACVLALGAEIAGYKNISVYDGSWTEWGSLVKD
ncbi:MAG: sulfurtransferase [Flaviramulus sp.]|nr:sulfurtransferase [Flaviramulus sp.]NNC50588.1 sulfurtransferase [Flaviramulus sp.]